MILCSKHLRFSYKLLFQYMFWRSLHQSIIVRKKFQLSRLWTRKKNNCWSTNKFPLKSNIMNLKFNKKQKIEAFINIIQNQYFPIVWMENPKHIIQNLYSRFSFFFPFHLCKYRNINCMVENEAEKKIGKMGKQIFFYVILNVFCRIVSFFFWFCRFCCLEYFCILIDCM